MNSEWTDIDVHGFAKADSERPQRAAVKLNGTMVALAFEPATLYSVPAAILNCRLS
jgi:hypothetical protein